MPTLQEVLDKLNRTFSFWKEDDGPATTANDRGVCLDYPLHKIAIWGDVAAAEVLLDHGADINARGEDDDTPLHRAIMGGHAEMVSLLLSRGANAEQRDRYGSSSRESAMSSGNDGIIGVMKRH